MSLLMKYFRLSVLYTIFVSSIYLTGCDKDNPSEPTAQTDDEYLTTTAINTAFSSNADDDDNLLANEVFDFDSEGAVSDLPSGHDAPFDSLYRWGRRISGVNINTNISSSGDTLKTVVVTRTISGNFIILGYINGLLDSAVKPYSQVQKRFVVFKRIERRNHPRFNWRVYQYSAVDGNTTSPQTGKDNILMNTIEFYKNNTLVLTLNGPDFTGNVFTAGHFGGNTFFDAERGDQIRVKVFLRSNQNDTDIVSYHWARNSYGFHRERFIMTSQTPVGSEFDRTFEKTFEIYNQHNNGKHNAFISANTRSSLYDNSPALFSSTYMGFPYKVRH